MTRFLILVHLFIFFYLSLPGQGQEEKSVSIGIFSDCQYCNCEPGTERYYRLSPEKLDSCIKELNSLRVDTGENAFSVLTLMTDSIIIKGYGKENSRRLRVR